MDAQDRRLDNLEGTLSMQHVEVMQALRALTGQSSSASAPGVKCPSELHSTPLKAESGGKAAKETRRLALSD